ncbi:MAG: glutathione S-transferase family protein [Aestuariivirga sp.]
MKIYGDIISPFVRSCLVTAHELGIADRIQHVRESAKPTEVNAHLTKLGALGRIPILETDHGHAIFDSRVIIEYLCHIAGNSGLIPDDGVKRFRVLTLQALAMGLGDTAVAMRYEVGARPQGLQWQEWLDRQKTRLLSAVTDMDKNWSAELTQVNAGSIAAAVVLAYIDFRMPETAWREGRPNLAAFHERFSARPSMQATKLG